MRQTAASDRGAWGSYIAAGLEVSGLSKAEFARRVGTDAGTVFRWLSGKHRPEKAEVVARVADVLGVDLDEALAAAGLRPTENPPAEPRTQTPPLDPYVAEMQRRLNDPEISEEEKAGYRALLRYAVDMQQPLAEPDRRRSPRRKAG